ncbi:hypothetical protein F2Q69_00006039 [Brassica cretica]|uniref:Uncharacterized protein n=1 Tax=Brassica cretica TaxID=69181 RepID=A0A8S9NX08_BRACR|nr:hypothetical protein F2Q69_00006039 [Brassica cretica]
MARRPFLLPPVPQGDEPEACSVIAIRPWSLPSSLKAFLQPQILVCDLEDDVAGASIIYQYPFHQAVRCSERYDQGVMMWGENLFLLLGRETYFVRTQEQAL